MIYVPNDSTYKYCPYVVNSTTIRVFDRQPAVNSSANYIDYYYNSNYLFTKGQQSWGSYATTPTCLQSSEITSNVFYRNDIDKVLICFIIILFICFYFPYKIISRLFGRWLKV